MTFKLLIMKVDEMFRKLIPDKRNKRLNVMATVI